MPTGYTSGIMDKGFNLNKWLVEDIPRAFGVCVTLRDAGDMSEKEIVTFLKKDCDNSYHVKELANHKAELVALTKYSDKKWREEMEKCNEKIERSKQRYIKENEKGMKKFSEIKEKILELRKRAMEELPQNILKFAQEQIESTMEHDFTYVPDDAPVTSVAEYKKDTIELCKDSIRYHAKEMQKEQDRNQDRLKGYMSWSKFVKDHLK